MGWGLLGARASRPHKARHGMNMDGKGEQDESLLHEKPARPMIQCGLADAQDSRTPGS